MTTGYIVFQTLVGALARSRLAARARGCQPGDTTQFWWEVRQHPLIPGSFVMLIDDTRPDFGKLILALGERTSVEVDPLVLAALDAPIDVVAGP